jgi:hypothetical protein
MRTKTLLLTAALGAAGMATSMAQVYSVNAVGYVNTVLHPGFSLIANPLNAADNTVGALFANVPNNTRIYKFNGTTYDIGTYSTVLGGWNPAAFASTVLNPGDGFFIQNPGGVDVTVTFVGEVPQGDLSSTLPAGLSIKASQVPQAGLVSTDLKYPPQNNDRIFKWSSTTSTYTPYTYSTVLGGWNPSEPSIDVGEAVFLNRATAGTWTRTFSVNQ